MSEPQLPLFLAEHGSLPPAHQAALAASDTLEAALPVFALHMRQRELSPHTIASFLQDLRLLGRFLGERATLSSCTTRRLEEFVYFLQYRRKTPCSPKSLERRITTLKVFFAWLAAAGVLGSDPAAALIHRRATSPLPHILTDQQVADLLAVTESMRDAREAPDARPHLLVTLLLATAIKKAECMRITLEHLDHSDPAHPSVYIHYDKPRQRFKARRLALPPDWVKTFEVYQRRYQPTQELIACTPRNLEYILHTLSILANLPEALTFEMMRWTSGVRSYRDGMEEERLRARLGLSRISWREVLPTIKKLAEQPL